MPRRRRARPPNKAKAGSRVRPSRGLDAVASRPRGRRPRSPGPGRVRGRRGRDAPGSGGRARRVPAPRGDGRSRGGRRAHLLRVLAGRHAPRLPLALRGRRCRREGSARRALRARRGRRVALPPRTVRAGTASRAGSVTTVDPGDPRSVCAGPLVNTTSPTSLPRRPWRRLISPALMVRALVVVFGWMLPQFVDYGQVWDALKQLTRVGARRAARAGAGPDPHSGADVSGVPAGTRHPDRKRGVPLVEPGGAAAAARLAAASSSRSLRWSCGFARATSQARSCSRARSRS